MLVTRKCRHESKHACTLCVCVCSLDTKVRSEYDTSGKTREEPSMTGRQIVVARVVSISERWGGGLFRRGACYEEGSANVSKCSGYVSG